MNLSKLEKYCQELGLKLEKKTEYHYQVTGGDFLVNYYPTKRRVYIQTTHKGYKEFDYKKVAEAALDLPDKIPAKSNRRNNGTRKNRLYRKQHGICALCGNSMDKENFNIDHNIPISKGGSDRADNVQATHYECNTEKSDKVSP